MRALLPGRGCVGVRGDEPGRAADDPAGMLQGDTGAVMAGFVVRTGRDDAHEPREAPLALAGIPSLPSTVPRAPRPSCVHRR
jgi:hypothetical protein